MLTCACILFMCGTRSEISRALENHITHHHSGLRCVARQCAKPPISPANRGSRLGRWLLLAWSGDGPRGSRGVVEDRRAIQETAKNLFVLAQVVIRLHNWRVWDLGWRDTRRTPGYLAHRPRLGSPGEFPVVLQQASGLRCAGATRGAPAVDKRVSAGWSNMQRIRLLSVSV